MTWHNLLKKTAFPNRPGFLHNQIGVRSLREACPGIALMKHYVVFLIIFLVRGNRVNWSGYSVISAGVRGTRMRDCSAFGAFAFAGLDGTRAGRQASSQVFLPRFGVLQSYWWFAILFLVG